jgi:hypothetical protein
MNHFWRSLRWLARLEIAVGVAITLVVLLVLAMQGPMK